MNGSLARLGLARHSPLQVHLVNLLAQDNACPSWLCASTSTALCCQAKIRQVSHLPFSPILWRRCPYRRASRPVILLMQEAQLGSSIVMRWWFQVQRGTEM